MTARETEKRRSDRHRRSDAMFWRATPDGRLRMGWLLEASDTGFAFAWRGKRAPAVDALIRVCLGLPGAPAESKPARVRRMSRVHNDLVVVAAELLDEPMHGPGAASIAEPKSMPRPVGPAGGETEIGVVFRMPGGRLMTPHGM